MSNYAPENTVGSKWKSERFATNQRFRANSIGGAYYYYAEASFYVETYREDNGDLSMYIFADIGASTGAYEIVSFYLYDVLINNVSLGLLTMHQIRDSNKACFTTDKLNVGKIAGGSATISIQSFYTSFYFNGDAYYGNGTLTYDSYDIGIQNRIEYNVSDGSGDSTRVVIGSTNKITILSKGYIQGYSYKLRIRHRISLLNYVTLYEEDNLSPGEYNITLENDGSYTWDMDTGYETEQSRIYINVSCYYNGTLLNEYTYSSDDSSNTKPSSTYNAYLGFAPNYISWEITDEREYYDTAIIGRQNSVSIENGFSGLSCKFVVNGISGTAFQFTGTSYLWSPSLQTYGSLLPNELSKTIRVSLNVYSGDNLIVTKSKNISFEILEEDVTPSVSLTVSEVGGYVSEFGGYVVGQSKISVSASGSARYGATGAGYTVSANGKVYSQNVFVTDFVANVSYNTITATFTDSRGLSVTATRTITIVNWFGPIVNAFSVHRGTWDGTTFTPTQDGGYCKIEFDFSIAPVGNNNDRYCAIEGSYGREVIQLSSYTAQGYIIQEADPEESFDIVLELRDSFGTYTWTIVLSTAGAIMDFYRNGNGVAFGKVAENPLFLDVSSDWTLRAYNIMVGSQTLAEYIHSVVGNT